MKTWFLAGFLLAGTSVNCLAQCCPPFFTTQPQSATNVQGTTATFWAVANGGASAVSYQWKFNGVDIPGATATNYVIAAVQYTNGGTYSVAGTNAAGWVISSNATLTVNGPPGITSQPVNVTKTETGTATFTVGAAGSAPLSYQWRFNVTNNIAGATSSALTLNNVQAWQAGNYSVRVTNTLGAVTSSTAVLTVTLPVGTVACWGDNSSNKATVPISVSYSNTQVFNTSGSTPDGDPICGYAQCHPVWQTYVPADSGVLTVDTKGTTFNAVLGVYTSPDLVNLISVGCSANHGVPAGENVTFTASKGVTYHVVVDGVSCASGAATLNFVLSVVTANGVQAIAAGGSHTLVLRTNGLVRAFGDNTFGQTNVPAGLSDVAAISAGYSHSLALLSDGTVAAWGHNGFGQTNVPPGLSNIVSISAGAYHNLALKSDGTVAAWGYNADGETNVPPGLSNVVQIAAGYYHNFALLKSGGVVGWGYNGFNENNIPPGVSNAVVRLSAGNGFCLALLTNGTITAWGDNSYNQTNVPGAQNNNVVAISAGGYHSLAIRTNGNVFAWGQNSYGQTTIPFVIARMVAVSAGTYHSASLQGSGAPYITVQPADQTVSSGANPKFFVMAAGTTSSAMKYQWQFNGANIATATNSAYVRANAQLADAGAYTVVLSNVVGMVTSSVATLTVDSTSFSLTPLGFTNTGFQLRLTGPPGTYTFDASPDLIFWDPVSTNTIISSPIIFTDPAALFLPHRFYRARQ